MSHIETYGFPSIEEIKDANGWPSEERLAKGPVALIECVQQIPCNPCVTACPTGAIRIEGSITNTPHVDFDSCIGCGKCIAYCPGLAIFVINYAYGETEASISFPYEYIPLPVVGDIVQAMNRAGEFVCEAKVIKIQQSKAFDHTNIMTIAIPKIHVNNVRTMRRLNAPPIAVSLEAVESRENLPDDVLVCRCEEITAGEIRRTIREHYAKSLNEIKKRTRAGMGLCQGRICQKLTSKILAEETGKSLPEIMPVTVRPPVRPITFEELAGE